MKKATAPTSNIFKPATLHDVARECGVSAMTASRVLSGRQGVGETTRERVLAAAQRLNYERNALAVNFARNRSGFIGVATPFEGLLGSCYFRDVMAGFQRALRETREDFALFDTMSGAFESPEELAKLCRQRKADGLLIVAPHKDDQYLKTLVELGVAFMVIGECVNEPSVPTISCDDAMGIRLLYSHLRALGHRDIAYISGPGNLGSARRRQRAFVNFMRAEMLDVPRTFVQHGAYTVDAGREATIRILEGRRRPTAIMGANDLAALGAIEVLQERGIRVPEDISVVGFDDLAISSKQELTTVRQPVREIGERGARILLNALETGELHRGHVDVDVSLVVRQTSGPAR